MDKPFFPKKPFRLAGGLKLDCRKHTAQSETVDLPEPKQVILPVSQHIGKPCEVCVAPGQRVYLGQKIAEGVSYVSSPIFASVSGVVKRIEPIKMPDGTLCDAVFIDSDFKMEKDPDIAPPVVTNKEELLGAIQRSGAVGLGGAGFPTHAKLNVNPDKVDTLIINAAECEPYITSDHREIIENTWNIMAGIYTLLEILGFRRVIIGVEENQPDAIAALTAVAENETHDPKDKVKVLKLKTRYPQGAEKMLIYACTKRVVPAGGLPLDVGCVVMNITTLAFVSGYLKTGMPLVSKRLTVDGDAISAPCNLFAPIGTPIKDILDFCGAEDAAKVLMGGPMMGTAVSDLNTPVLKQNNAILALTAASAALPEETACIRCGRCVRTCPVRLFPVTIAKAADRKDGAALEKLRVGVCIECGLCSYVCPAKIHLTQRMRIGKALLREHKQK